MPLQPIEFNSAEEVNAFILNLRKGKFFNEDKLSQEHVVTTDGKTYPVSKILELSDEECEEYSDIKFFARTKEKPENDDDFAIYSLKEFKNSTNKKFFVYNKMFGDALLAIDKGRTIHDKRYAYQNVAIQYMDTQCALTHGDIIFPAITPYNTYEATAILKYLKSNIDNGLKVTDPITHFLGYLPPDKIVFNRALASLITINHQNFIKNKCDFFLKNIKNQTNTQTAIQEAKVSLGKHLNNLQESVEVNKNTEMELPKYKEILEQRYAQLKENEKQFKVAEETIRKYSQGDFSDYSRLKKEISDINNIYKSKLTNLVGRLYIFPILGASVIGIDIILGAMQVITNGLINAILAGVGLGVGVVGMIIKSTFHHGQRRDYALIIDETNKLLAKIDEINKLQKTIDLTKRHQKLCELMLQFMVSFDLITLLENEIPESLRSQEDKLTSPSALSSSEYLLKTGGIDYKLGKTVNEIKKEENEARKEERDEVTINMSEDVTESSYLLRN